MALSQFDIHQLIEAGNKRFEQDTAPAPIPEEKERSVEGLLYKIGVQEGTIEPTWADTSAGAVERGIISLGAAIPGLWQMGAHAIQERVRRGQFAHERAKQEDWKDVIAMGMLQSNPVAGLLPTRWWPEHLRKDYEEYKKQNPLALQDEERWTSKIFNMPAQEIRKQTKQLLEQYPWMEAEETRGFKDIISDPQKLLATVLESTPLMVASGAAMLAGAPPVAFALMYGAEGNEAYEEAIAQGRSEDEALEAFHMYGLAAAAIEYAQVGHFMKLGKSQYKAILGRTARKIKKKTAVDGVKSLTKEWLKAQGMESVEEMTQGTWSEITAYAVYGKKPEGGVPGFIDRRATDAVAAFAMGLPFGAPAIASDVIQGGTYERDAKTVSRDKEVMDSVAENLETKKDDFAVPEKLSKRHAVIEDFVRRVFGKSIVWYLPNNQQSIANDFDGWAHPTDPGIIMLNANSPKPLMSTAFHESMHQLEVENPEGYNELKELVAGHISNKPELANIIQRKLEQVGYEGDPDMVEREILADTIGYLASDPAFLDAVAGRNPSILESVGRSLDDIYNTFRKALQKKETRQKEVEVEDIEWLSDFLSDIEGLRNGVSAALERITRSQREAEAAAEQEVVAEEEAELAPVAPEPVTPGDPEKKKYTTIPDGWGPIKTLSDWGNKGLRIKGEGKVKGRKFFDSAWLSQLTKLPTRLPKETLAYLRKMTDEIFYVENRQGENYYLVPKKALEEARAQLPPQAFERGPKPERAPAQRIADVVNALENQGVSPEEIGRVVETMARDFGIPVEELPQRSYELVYKGRGQEVPVHRGEATSAYEAYVEATRHPEMTQEKQQELRGLVEQLGKRDELMKKRRLTKAQKAKLATLPTREQVMFEIDKYRPEAMKQRQEAEKARREAGEALSKPEELTTKPAKEIAERKAEESKMLAERKPGLIPIQYAVGKYLFHGGHKKKTQESIRAALKPFVKFLEEKGITDIQDITPEHIREYQQILGKRNLKGSTINTRMSQIKGMFDMLKADGDIGITPWEAGEVVRAKAADVMPKIVSRETVNKLVSEIEDTPTGLRDKAIIKVLFDTGLRVSELLGTEIPTADALVKYVMGKGGKERKVLITPEAMGLLEQYIEDVRSKIKGADQQTAVFLTKGGTPLTRQAVWRMVKKRFGTYGVKLTTHDLRASFATDMLEHGMGLDVLQALMGHADVTTTGKYLRLSPEFLKQQVRKYLPRPSVRRVSIGQQRISEGKKAAVNLTDDLSTGERYPGVSGWLLEDGSIYPVLFKGDGAIWRTHYEDARRVGYTTLQMYKSGAVRLSSIPGRNFNEIAVEWYDKLTDAQRQRMVDFILSNSTKDKPTEVFFKVHMPKGRRDIHVSHTFKKSQTQKGISDLFDMVKEQSKPMPSVSRKSRRIYTTKKPTGRILDTAERAAGRRAQARRKEMTEEELMKLRMRVQRDTARQAFKAGAQAYKEKIGELKQKLKTAKELRREMRRFVQETLPLAMRGKMLVAIEKIEDADDFQEATERLYNVIETMEKRQALARLKRFQKKFNKKYRNKTKTLYKKGSKFRLDRKTSEIFETIFRRITTRRGRTDAEKADLKELLQWAQKERREAAVQARELGEDIDYNPYVAHEIDTVIENLKTELEAIPIAEWTSDQIDALTAGMQVLLASYEWQRSDYKERWESDRNQDISYSMAELQSSWRKPKKPRPRDVQSATNQYRVRNIWSFLKGLVGRHNYNLQTLVEIMSGAKKGVLFERLVQDIQASVDNATGEMFYMQEAFQHLLKHYGITWEDLADWTRLARVRGVKLPKGMEAFIERIVPEHMRPSVARRDALEVNVELESGQTLRGTVMELVDILMHLRNNYNYENLKDHGGVFRDDPLVTLKFTDADFAAIRKAVPPKALKMVELMDTLVEIQQERINAVSQEVDGFDIANVSGYWHMRRSLEKPGVKGEGAKYSYETIEGRSQWKQRVGGKQPIILGDAVNNLLETLQVGSEYIGMTESMRTARYITNNRALHRAAMERGYGDYWKDIVTQLNRLQEKKNLQAWYETFYGWMARGVTRAVFGFNLRVSAQQYASVFLATSELGFDALKYMRARPTKPLVERISRWSPMLRERFLGAIGRELGDTAKIGSAMRFMTGKDQLMNVPTFLVRFFDKLAITDVWRMAEGRVVERYKKQYPGVTTAELLEDAEIEDIDKRKYPRFQYDVVRLAEETVRATQPTWHIVDRSVIGSDRNPLVRALTMFHSQREKLAQMIGVSNSRMMNELERIRVQYGLDSLREAAKTKEGVRAIRRMAQTYGIVLTNTAIVKAWAMMYGVALFKRDDDMYDWATAVIADVPGMYYFGDIPRDVIVAWGKKMRGKRVYQLGAYESPPIRVVSTARMAAYEMGNLVMLTMSGKYVTDKEMSKQIERTLDATWESANYALGLPFMHGTSILNAWRKDSGPKRKKGKR
jgi:integrase/recombinase XerD